VVWEKRHRPKRNKILSSIGGGRTFTFERKKRANRKEEILEGSFDSSRKPRTVTMVRGENGEESLQKGGVPSKKKEQKKKGMIRGEKHHSRAEIRKME